jgi:hypothetical protein
MSFVADRRAPGQGESGRRVSPTIARWPLVVADRFEQTGRVDSWVAIVRESIADYRAGRADRASRHWDDEIAWRVAGRLPEPGEWVGPEQVFDYHRLMEELTGGSFRQQLVSLEASGGPIVAAHLRTTASRAGRRLGIPSLAVFELSGCRIRAVTEIPGDREAWRSFWAG